MTKSRLLVALAATTALAGTLAITDKAQAVPSFARQYKAECKTCHTIFPERNEFGEAFEKNSYVWPGTPGEKGKNKVTPKKNDIVEEWLELANIPALGPLSFLAANRMSYNTDLKPELDLGRSTTFEAFAAGSFRDKAGFWANYNFSFVDKNEDKKNKVTGTAFNALNTTASDSSKVNDGLGQVRVQFRHPLGLPLNILVGKASPNVSLWVNGNRPTISGLPSTGVATQNLVELNSIVAKRLFLAAGVTNTSSPSTTNAKDAYGAFAYRLGGTDYLGNEPEVDLDKDHLLDYLSITMGGFGYVGSNHNSFGDTNINNYYRYGVESEILYKRFKTRLGGYFFRDDNPTFSVAAPVDTHARTIFAQTQYLVGADVMLSMRYDHLDNGTLISRKVIPSVSYTPWENLRLAADYIYTNNPKTTQASSRELLFEIKYLF